MSDEPKLMIIIRKDLGMRAGKMAAQAGHAVQYTIRDYSNSAEFNSWEMTGSAKICVRVESEKELFDIFNQARDADLPRVIVKDAGRTELKEPTYTTVAIGPSLPQDVDKITGKLRLL